MCRWLQAQAGQGPGGGWALLSGAAAGIWAIPQGRIARACPRMGRRGEERRGTEKGVSSFHDSAGRMPIPPLSASGLWVYLITLTRFDLASFLWPCLVSGNQAVSSWNPGFQPGTQTKQGPMSLQSLHKRVTQGTPMAIEGTTALPKPPPGAGLRVSLLTISPPAQQLWAPLDHSNSTLTSEPRG